MAVGLTLAGCELPSAVLPNIPLEGVPGPGGIGGQMGSTTGKTTPAPMGTPTTTPRTSGGSASSSPASGAVVRGEAAVRPLATAAAQKEGLSVGLVMAVVSRESAFNSRAVSSAGAQGLMQLMPGTVTHINSAKGAVITDPFDPAQNLAGGCWYLKWVKSQVPSAKVVAGQEWHFTLAGYNAGAGYVNTVISKALAGAPRNPQVTWADVSSKFPAETQSYVPLVMGAWDKYGR